MRVLGISEIDSDAGGALIEDGRIVFAANEERFSRQKLHRGFPHQSIDWLFKESGWRLEEIDAVVIAKPPLIEETKRNFAPYFHYNWFKKKTEFSHNLLEAAVHFGHFLPASVRINISLNRQINRWLARNHIPEEKLFRVNHHLAHAASAYYTSGFNEACVVTCDGQGAGETATVWHGKSGKLKKLRQVHVPNSLGYFYSLITYLLGFKPNRHEGKITGLAGYGLFDPAIYEVCREVARYHDDGTFTVHNLFGNYFRFKNLVVSSPKGREGAAAAFQRRLEEVVVPFVRYYVRKLGVESIALAGGVFANVKLNQRVREIPEIKEIFIFPQMGDGGLAVGAALAWFAERNQLYPKKLSDVYFGPKYSDEEIERCLRESGLAYRRSSNLETEVAQLLRQKKVVALFQERMEYGPRALGNRSILYEAGDPAVNDWLNKRLGRSEFMPFAPVTLWEDRHQYYQNIDGADYAAQFMTITTNCTDKMKQESPAAVHKDGTARPQLIKREQNPRYYKILEEYKKLTGRGTIVNTSFNMHEEPIVCTPEDAIRSYRRGHLDILAIGTFLVG